VAGDIHKLGPFRSAALVVRITTAVIALPSKWRMLGPIESILGILMCGLSVSLLFAIATRLVGNER